MASVRLRRDVSSAETCGFATYLLSFPIGAAYIIWAFLPEHVLHSAGVTYYPPQEMAAHLPTFSLALFVAVPLLYAGLNFLSAPSATSLDTLWDGHSREYICKGDVKMEAGEGSRFSPSSVPEICDIDVGVMNRVERKILQEGK